MVFSEGVPPSKEVRDDYIEIFRLKEKRLTFYREDLVALMENAGFKEITLKTLVLPQMSVRNWLDNSGLQKSIKDKIYRLHINSKDYFKKDYNMTITNSDCFIDSRPSDAIALALRTGSPIFIEDAIFSKMNKAKEGAPDIDDLRKRLRDIDPSDFGKFTI